MKQITTAAFYLLFALFLARAQDAAPKKPDSPKSIPMSIASENKILKAEHARDEILKQEADVRDKFNQLQIAGKQLQDQFADLQKKDTESSKAVEDAIETAWKESGLDKAEYAADVAGFQFTPKPPEKTAEAKAVEKK